jgi:hypothetical protein
VDVQVGGDLLAAALVAQPRPKGLDQAITGRRAEAGHWYQCVGPEVLQRSDVRSNDERHDVPVSVEGSLPRRSTSSAARIARR